MQGRADRIGWMRITIVVFGAYYFALLLCLADHFTINGLAHGITD
jgi:hypothetical protein